MSQRCLKIVSKLSRGCEGGECRWMSAGRPLGMPLDVHGPPAGNFIGRRAGRDHRDLRDNREGAGDALGGAERWKGASQWLGWGRECHWRYTGRPLGISLDSGRAGTTGTSGTTGRGGRMPWVERSARKAQSRRSRWSRWSRQGAGQAQRLRAWFGTGIAPGGEAAGNGLDRDWGAAAEGGGCTVGGLGRGWGETGE